MPGKTAGFRRSLFAGMIGASLVILVMTGITACGSGSIPASVSPVPEARPNLSTTISCSVPAPHSRSTPTYLWLVLDRSESMRRECADSLEKFFLLPGFFAHVAKLVQPEDLYFALSLIGPDQEFLSPTLVSRINEREILRSPDIGNSPTNEYEKALKRIKDQMIIQQVRRVAVILTDGTFAAGYEKEERKSISETLQQIQNIGGEVYVLLCSTSNREFWEELKANDLLSAPPYYFPEGVIEVGKELFPGRSPRNMGWFSDLPNFEIQLPAQGVTASVSLAVIAADDAHFNITRADTGAQVDDFPLYHLVKNANIYVGDYAFDLSRLPPVGCQGCVLRFNRQHSVDVGFYIAQSSPWSEHRFDVNIGISVNDGEGTVEFSPCQSLVAPSCYTFSLNFLNFKEIITPLEQNKFAWKPSFESERPQNLSASVYLQIAGDDTLLDCGIISLPIKFAPEPTQDRVVIKTSLQNIRIKEYSFSFRYVPPSPRPEIYLCSSEPPPSKPHECDLQTCGTPYPDGQTMVCPTPESYPEEWCVQAEFIESPKGDPTREHPIVASESSSGYTSIYTIRLYECLEKCCKYEQLYFQWPESESTVATSIIYKKSAGTWHLESVR